MTATAESNPVSQPPPVRVERIHDRPLLTPASNSKLGTNLNGPCLIRVPDWVPDPLGRYYLYFAHHQGAFIRMAWANAVEGPYTVYDPGVLPMAETPFKGHIASPEVIVDHPARRIRMLYHGAGTLEPNATGHHQVMAHADSADGLRFVSERRYLAESYLRVFRHEGWWIGFSGGAQRRLSRSRALNEPFEPGPVLEIEGETFTDPAAGVPIDRMYRIRHVALQVRGGNLLIYYSSVGDAPERIRRTVVPLTGGWTAWRGRLAQDVLRPERPYEGSEQPLAPSAGGAKHYPVNEVRDPFVFEEAGQTWLFYTVAGEQGIALARIWDPEAT